jgi:GNAT superfamily N-acetyltransferase
LTLGIFEANDENDGSLLAMIHGTRTSSTYASDASMAIGGHEPHGSTVGLHTLCVHPGWRAKGLGTRILKEYLKRMESEKGVERVALIAHDELVPFYERCSFRKASRLIVGLDS